MKKIDCRHLPKIFDKRRVEGNVSHFVFYIIIAFFTLLFLLFRFVGFDIPYEDNPDYNAPLLTSLLITSMLVLVAGTLALSVWSFVRKARMNKGDNRIVNNIPVHRITLGVIICTAALLFITFLCSSTDTLTVNGSRFADSFWLRMSGMFIGTSIIMICAAVVALVYGITRNRR